MIEVNYGFNYDNSQGIQFALANQKLKVADERYPHVVLPLKDSNNQPILEDEINIQKPEKCNLLIVRTTKPLPDDSPSKLKYKIGDAGAFVELDAPLFLLGTWITSFNSPANGLKITFQIDPAPDPDSEESVEVEVAIGWTETL